MRSGKLRHTTKAKSTWHRGWHQQGPSAVPTVPPWAWGHGDSGHGSLPAPRWPLSIPFSQHGAHPALWGQGSRCPQPHLAGGEAAVLVQAEHRVRPDGRVGEEAVAGLQKGGKLNLGCAPGWVPGSPHVPAPRTSLLPSMTLRGTVIWGHFSSGGGGSSQLHSTRICSGVENQGWGAPQGGFPGLPPWGVLGFAGLSTPRIRHRDRLQLSSQ